MKLVHVTIEPIGSALGGGARYAAALIGSLEQAGVSQRILLATRAGGEIRCRDLSGSDTFELGHWIDSSVWVLVHSPDTHALHVAERLGREFDCRIAAIDYGGMTLSWAERLIPRRVRYRSMEVCFAISEYSARRTGLPWHRVVTVYGGGDHILAMEPEGRYAVVDFTFVGRILPHKGVHLLVGGLPSGASIRCVGPGWTWDTPYGKDIEQKVRDRGGEVLRDLPDPHLRSVLGATRWLVLPTVDRPGIRKLRRAELLGLVLLEAAAVGTPSIVSTAGALPEIAALVGSRVCQGQGLAHWTVELSNAMSAEDASAQLPAKLHWSSVASAIASRLR